jgi:hypothetical protein
MEVFNGSLQRMLAQKKFGKPLDKTPIKCYNKHVKRGRKTPQTRKDYHYGKDDLL